MPVFVLIPHCFDYSSFAVLSEVWKCMPCALFFSLQNCFGNSGSSMAPHKILVCSFTQSQTSWNVKSSGPQEALLRTNLVEVMEFQLSYFKNYLFKNVVSQGRGQRILNIEQVKNNETGSIKTVFQVWLYHLLVTQFWTNYFIFLSFKLSILKIPA